MIMGLTGGIASGKSTVSAMLIQKEHDSLMPMSSQKGSCSRDIPCWLLLQAILAKAYCCLTAR